MIDRIFKTLYSAAERIAGKNFRLCGEDGENFQAPCFSVSAKCSQNRIDGTHYFSKNDFTICYFPRQDGRRTSADELEAVAGDLARELSSIVPEGKNIPVPGTRIKHDTAGGILTFKVGYDMFLVYSKKGANHPRMKSRYPYFSGETEGGDELPDLSNLSIGGEYIC